MGDCKLNVNIAKYTVENADTCNLDDGYPNNSNSVGMGDKFRTFSFRDFRSYSDVLGKEKVSEDVGKEVESNQVVEKQECKKSVVLLDRTEAFKDMFGKAVVGRTVDLETLVDFDRLLRIARTDFSNIQYLGGLSILISFSDEVSTKKLLDSREVWGPWFSKLDAWEGQSLPLERVAWLRLHGVPLHLLDPVVLKMIGELFTKVLYVQKILWLMKKICR
ncbi:hypothetical protein HanIR_Chr10g0470271 [Helianthus annuus]|nr:hypothetical protein HanIR_Chr10g0470271 [Helianthus annuus]KAJ0696517.1 hypothetical protein HanLR1_Chr10g0358021 [Helianthus annuus]